VEHEEPMPSKYPIFDRGKLNLLPLPQRQHDLSLADILDVGQAPMPYEHPDLPALAEAILQARTRGSTVAMLIGAHVLKRGLGRYVADLLDRGLLSVLACNGACAIHDYEFARIGSSTESVARYIRQGQFGLWKETGDLNDVVAAGDREGLGFGEALGKHIAESGFPHKDLSIFAHAYRKSIPATVHVGIGYDIVHEHPNFDGAAAGSASYRDFLIFTKALENLEGGVVLCYGTAVMGPEVYLKALSMVRNVAHAQGRSIRNFTSAVFDLVNLGSNPHAEAPKDSPEYYYRPFKTVLVRTVQDGGRSFYFRGDHRATLPALHRLLTKRQ
jgi:hypothetical protein